MSQTIVTPTPAGAQLSPTITDNLSSPFYRVENFGFLTLASTEQYADTWYPTPSDKFPGGWFSLALEEGAAGDFNGDGRTDLVIKPMMMPHIVPRETPIYPLFLFQDAEGNLQAPATPANLTGQPNKHHIYRIGLYDFNNDGALDVAFSTMNRPTSYRDSNGHIFDLPESPLVVFGGKQPSLAWTDQFTNLTLENWVDNWGPGYAHGHSMASGDFNGDGRGDFFSNNYAFYGNGTGNFQAAVVPPNAGAVPGTTPTPQAPGWLGLNAAAAGDFNEDGYDDVLFSTMAQPGNTLNNGGDLWLLRGSGEGLQGGHDAVRLPRSSPADVNIATNYSVPIDINGDGHLDIIYLEHFTVDNNGDSSRYYTGGTLKAHLGDGAGNFRESPESVFDPFAGNRHGEGVLHAMDVNGDGWKDLVAVGFTNFREGDNHTFATGDQTAIFLNQRGSLAYVDRSNLAFVQKYQIAGHEGTQPYQPNRVNIMQPVDLGDDGMVDFVGFVGTPFSSWPQTEIDYNYAFISRAVSPLGRVGPDEYLPGTQGNDRIFGYEGNDTLSGRAGNDTLVGGPGTDTAEFGGLRAGYQITLGSSSDTVRVTDILLQDGNDGSDDLHGIEMLAFADASTLDLGRVAGLNYIAANPDLIAAFGLNPAAGLSHYGAFGHAEGRTSNFDALAYLASNPDLIDAFGTNVDWAVEHYINFGYGEGRVDDGFDVDDYLAANPDLQSAFGNDPTGALLHYLTWGYHEGRITEAA